MDEMDSRERELEGKKLGDKFEVGYFEGVFDEDALDALAWSVYNYLYAMVEEMPGQEELSWKMHGAIVQVAWLVHNMSKEGVPDFQKRLDRAADLWCVPERLRVVLNMGDGYEKAAKMRGEGKKVVN